MPLTVSYSASVWKHWREAATDPPGVAAWLLGSVAGIVSWVVSFIVFRPGRSAETMSDFTAGTIATIIGGFVFLAVGVLANLYRAQWMAWQEAVDERSALSEHNASLAKENARLAAKSGELDKLRKSFEDVGELIFKGTELLEKSYNDDGTWQHALTWLDQILKWDHECRAALSERHFSGELGLFRASLPESSHDSPPFSGDAILEHGRAVLVARLSALKDVFRRHSRR